MAGRVVFLTARSAAYGSFTPSLRSGQAGAASEMVAREIELLYNEMGCSIFMFKTMISVAQKTVASGQNVL